jgi:hypothetical protein
MEAQIRKRLSLEIFLKIKTLFYLVGNGKPRRRLFIHFRVCHSNKRLTRRRRKKRGNGKRTHRRHEISDELWNKMERLLPDFDDIL